MVVVAVVAAVMVPVAGGLAQTRGAPAPRAATGTRAD